MGEGAWTNVHVHVGFSAWHAYLVVVNFSQDYVDAVVVCVFFSRA